MKRKPPKAKDDEKIVVGSAMRDMAVFLDLAKIVRKAEMFQSFAHQCVWRCFYRMHREGLPFKPQTVLDVLAREKMNVDVPAHYLIELWESGGATTPIYQAEQVVDDHVRRMSKEAVRIATEDFGDLATDPAEAADRLKAELTKIAAESYAHDEGGDGREDDGGFRPFPLNALPSVIGEYAEAGSIALRCNAAFVAVPCLVAFGSCIGNSAVIELKATWREPAIYWAAIVAEPSSMKSPSLDQALSPLMGIQQALGEKYDKQWDSYRNAIEEWNDRRYKRGKNGSQEGEDPKPKKPVQGKALVMDITIEKLAHVLYDNPNGVCLGLDELSGWFQSFGRYSEKGGGGGDMSKWLQLYGGRSLIVDRKTGDPPSIYIPRASCSVVGGIQPKILARQLTSETFESGLAARLLPCMPPGAWGEWTEDVIPMDVWNGYHSLVNETYYAGVEAMQADNAAPTVVGFTEKGKAAFVEFFNDWNRKQHESEGDTKAALAKLKAYCARFCLLLAVADHRQWTGKELAVTELHVKRAVDLVEWFAHETDRVYRRLKTPADEEARESLLSVIEARGGMVTASDLIRSNRKRYPSKDEAEMALEELVEKGFGQWMVNPTAGKRGRPTKVFRLHPPKT